MLQGRNQKSLALLDHHMSFGLGLTLVLARVLVKLE